MKIVEKTWESEKTGLKFGEVVFDYFDGINNNEACFRFLEKSIKDFDFVIARIKTELSDYILKSPLTYVEDIKKINPNFKLLSDLGFKLQDIQVFFSVESKSKIFATPIDTSRWSDVTFKQNLDESEINFITDFFPSYFRFSWYFKEIPEIAEKIYREWVKEIILSDKGIYVFAIHKYDNSKFGFFGAKNVDFSARFPLLFSRGIPSYVIAKKFGQILREKGFKNLEIKISLILNQKFALLYEDSITKANSYIEIIMSKRNF